MLFSLGRAGAFLKRYMAAKSDYYDILGVTKSASAEEIKKAYRKQALEWHPDRHPQDKEVAERRFKEVNEAYQILSDSQKRSAYDQFGHDAFSPGGMPGGGFGGAGGPFTQGGRYGPFTYTYTQQGQGSPFAGFDFGDPFEIFEQFFGGMGGNPFGQRARVPRYGLKISFMEAINGVEKTINIGGRKRKIKIPPGVDNGSRINFGDFQVTIDVEPHEIFEREGADIYVKVAIPFSLAALGGAIEVPTVEGDLTIRIRPGTEPRTMMRLKGKGAPIVQGRGRGDEYVRLDVVVPTKLTGRQRELIEELAEEDL